MSNETLPIVELTELGRAAQLDAATVQYCVALLEFRASSVPLRHSPKAKALSEAAEDMRRMLLAEQVPA